MEVKELTNGVHPGPGNGSAIHKHLFLGNLLIQNYNQSDPFSLYVNGAPSIQLANDYNVSNDILHKAYAANFPIIETFDGKKIPDAPCHDCKLYIQGPYTDTHGYEITCGDLQANNIVLRKYYVKTNKSNIKSIKRRKY